MSDGVDIMKNMKRVPGVNYPVLIPNLKGYETAVSESFFQQQSPILSDFCC